MTTVVDQGYVSQLVVSQGYGQGGQIRGCVHGMDGVVTALTTTDAVVNALTISDEALTLVTTLDESC